MKREMQKASGLFLALLALVVQLAAAAAVPLSMVSLANMTVLCRHGSNPGGPVAPVHQMPNCQLCFICHGTTGPAGLLTAAPLLPRPIVVRMASAVILPPVTTPPARFATAAQPRGPPTLV